MRCTTFQTPSYVAEFTSDIRNMPGKDNVVADALSRPAAVVAPSAALPVDWTALARSQADCPHVQGLVASSGLQVKRVEIKGAKLLCDVSMGVLRPLVPDAQQLAVFHAIHDLAHLGIRTMQRLVSSRFVWRGCASDVAQWCRDCQQCARGKVTRQEKMVVKISLPDARF